MKVATFLQSLKLLEIDKQICLRNKGEKLQNLKEEAQSDLHNMMEDGENEYS